MTRKIVISHVLCALLLIGQLPAWMHVSVCPHHHGHNHSAIEFSATANSSDPCDTGSSSCCCSHNSSNDQQESKPDETASSSNAIAGFNAGHSHDGHDADDCVLCLSLRTPGSSLSTSFHFSHVERLVEYAVVTHVTLRAENIGTIFLPRGPPASI